jgi:hypothetical protein
MNPTPLTDAQLDRIRQTVASTIEEWRMSYRVKPELNHRDLENMMVAAMVAMHQSGAITINNEAARPEGGV